MGFISGNKAVFGFPSLLQEKVTINAIERHAIYPNWTSQLFGDGLLDMNEGKFVS